MPDMRSMRTTRLLPALLFLSLLGAAPAAAADCPGADLAPGSDPVAVRSAIVCLSNEERTSRGLGALTAEGRLESAAQRYSDDLVADSFFAHVSPSGQTLTDRVAGYTNWKLVGENLAWGEGSLGTPRGIVAAWMGSPAHRENLLSPSFTEVGIGTTAGAPTAVSLNALTVAAEYGVRYTETAPQPAQGAAKPRRVKTSSCRPGTTRRVVRKIVEHSKHAKQAREARQAREAQQARQAQQAREAQQAC